MLFRGIFLPKFQGYLLPKRINESPDSIIYRISDSKAAKVDKYGRIDRLEKEHNIMRKLFLKGVSVPIPCGIHYIRTLGKLFASSDALIMEYIPGKPHSKFTEKEYYHVEMLMKLELEKAREMGFKEGVYNINDVVWCRPENRIYLVGFADWEMPTS